MAPLIRIWLVPGRLRRLPTYGKFALAAIYLLAVGGGAIAILTVKGSISSSIVSLIAIAIPVFVTPSALCAMGMFAGATLIAGERQRQTWEPIQLSSTSVRTIVLLKYCARLVTCLVWAAVLVVWTVSMIYVITKQSHAFYTQYSVAPSHHVLRARVGILLTWTSLQLVSHLIPFVGLGAAVSARCRKTKTALMICSAILAAYGVILWFIAARFGYSILTPAPGDWKVVLRWPVLPYLSGEYQSARGLLPNGWRANLGADLIWTLVVTAVSLCFAISWSGLPRRRMRVRRTARFQA